MRKPQVKNKYNIAPKDIEKAQILNRDRLSQKPFWRNDVVHAWCLSGGSGSGVWGGYDNEYWIGFYDEDAPAYAGRIKLSCSSNEGMCTYRFRSFFNYNEIEHEIDLELQEKLLERINWLIDEKIIRI